MKACLKIRHYDIYDLDDYISADELAKKTLNIVYGHQAQLSDLPLDPFKALNDSGAFYRFLDFRDIEGIYLLPKNSQDPNSVASVGLKYCSNTRLTRLRFTAAHELCHHLKDEKSSISCQSDHNPIEVYANRFASAFLMPEFLLRQALIKENITSFDIHNDTLLNKMFEISLQFQTSFESTLIRIKKIFKIQNYINFKNIISKFSPDSKKHDFPSASKNEIICLQQIINSGNYDIPPRKSYHKIFLDRLIFNDHRIEDGSLSPARIEQTLATIRLEAPSTEKIQVYRKKHHLNDADMSILGEYSMYKDWVFKKSENDSFVNILKLNQLLFKYVFAPQVGGKIRDINAIISGKRVHIDEPEKIYDDLFNLATKCDTDVFHSKGDALLSFIRDHHTFTLIHPFDDGNGRTSRAFLNMQLESHSLPMVYVKECDREKYQHALEMFDSTDNCEELFKFFCYFIMEEYLTYSYKIA